MFLALTCGGLSARASELITNLFAPSETRTNGERVVVWLNILNPGTATAEHSVAPVVPAHLVFGSQTVPFKLILGAEYETSRQQVAPGGFIRIPYYFVMPERIEGSVQVMLTNPPHSAVTFVVPPSKKKMLSGPSKAAAPDQPVVPFDANDYFRRHFYGYDPVYFIAGAEVPTAKFQFSLRYRPIDVGDTGLDWVAQRFAHATNIYFAYTQVSLWDLAAPSSPFLDTSYKPEVHYWWQNVTRADPDAHFHFDLQGGYQHESNGKDVPDSRSINMLYLQPTLFFGDRNRLHLSLGARAWVYILDLSDNPDIADYRGHFDVRATLGWPDNVQLSALARVGDGFDHGSAMLDLTYPLFGASGRGLSLYLHAQYFTGYGESLLEYNRRSDAIRFGFSIYR